ncbi:hypothetical protein V2053_003182 [Vibrio cholerae]|nr:hypothetical protein [Vibrio cholerae]EJL6310946.1 hypothetical protein [Vibrio cholerae]EKF9842516.1 hypothetical protein [Vibrio cholerae]HCJ7273242.1 hypothetical protein [Vibrio cholerae]HCJ7280530.1 hypothetical protein [Vibrio cholerae]
MFRFGYRYNCWFTEGSRALGNGNKVTLKVPAQKGDNIYFGINKGEPRRYEVVMITHTDDVHPFLTLKETTPKD